MKAHSFLLCPIGDAFLLAGVWYLPSLHIHRVVFLINQIRHLHKLIALAFERGDERIQCLGGVLGTVVAQDDGTIAQMLVIAYGIHDGVYAVVLPVEGVHILNTWIQLILGVLCYMDGHRHPK